MAALYQRPFRYTVQPRSDGSASLKSAWNRNSALSDERRHQQRGCKQNQMTDNRLTADVWLRRGRHVVALKRRIARRRACGLGEIGRRRAHVIRSAAGAR
jgi:hypothetical protein